MATTSLSAAALAPLLDRLTTANADFAARFPGESPARQATHTLYGGAHLFRHDAARKLGDAGLRILADYGPDSLSFARAIGLRGSESLPADPHIGAAMREQVAADPAAARRSNPSAWLAHTVYERLLHKLKTEPVEDYRIDFEDGYGVRSDAEEDQCAEHVAAELARGMKESALPPFIGIRVKPLNAEYHRRALRTLDILITALAHHAGGRLPPNFVVMLPKVVLPEQVAAAAEAMAALEQAVGLPARSLRLEVMIETTQAIIGPDGRCTVPALVAAAGGRCVAAHFGVYDYTASCTITAEHQHMVHPACDFARHAMQVALGGTGVTISDGATNLMPIPPHRAEDGKPLSPQQIAENRAAVHLGWRTHFAHVRHSLVHAYYQGWDLNPAQLPTRFAAVYSFFLEGLDAAADRLRNFVDKAARATLAGGVFDDAATGQGLLNFFLRGLNCGAITEDEARTTGLTLEELRSRSFQSIISHRAHRL